MVTLLPNKAKSMCQIFKFRKNWFFFCFISNSIYTPF